MGPSPYGVIALIGTVSSLASTVALLGIDLSYARYFLVNGNTGEPAIERFCWRFAITLGLAVSFAVGLAWWLLLPAASANRNLAFVTGMTTLVAVLIVMALTRQRILGAYSRVATATLLGGGFGVLLSILLAKYWRPDARAMLWGTLVGSLLSLWILGLPGAPVLLQASGLNQNRRRALLSLGLASTVTAPMFWIMGSVDRWLLGIWVGTGAVGVYAFAASLGLSGMLVNNAVSLAWFPAVSREFVSSGEGGPKNIARLWVRLAGLHMLTWLVVAAAGGDVIRLLADPRFHGGAPLVPWLAGSVCFNGIAALANTGHFLNKDLKPTAIWWTAGACFNVACNSLLIRPFGPMGASIAGCLSYALIMVGMLWSGQGRLHLPLPWGRLGLAAMLSLASGILMSLPWGRAPLLSLLLKLPVGVFVCALVGMVLAPDWVRRFVDRIRRSYS
jgi:O-antigen/teichoic acid export membrane protein